jgi:hypothetical protein
VDLNDLTATLYFAAAVRAGADSSLTRLLPLQLLKEPLSPHENFSQRILFALQALGVIEPELSLSNAEDWLTAKDWIQIGPQTLAWRICWSPGDCRERSTMANVLLSGIEPSEDVLDVLLDVWRDLALAEVVQYASWTLGKSGYNPKWAEVAIPGFQGALKVFSIAQVMHLIQLAMRSLTSVHQRGGIASSRLGTVFADSLSYFSHRAKLEKWTVREVSRPTELPVSAIVALFAQEVTRLGDEYVTRAPSTAALLDAMTRVRSVH